MQEGQGTTAPTPKLSPRVAAIAREPGAATLMVLWNALSLDERARAFPAAAELEGPHAEAWALDAVARAAHVREQTAREWPRERLYAEAARLRPRSPALVTELLTSFHRRHRLRLLDDYLDALGLEHEDGLTDEEAGLAAGLTEADAEAAARAIVSRHPPDHAVVYFALLGLVSHLLVPGLGRWLPAIAGELDVSDVDVDGEAAEGPARTEDGHAPEDTDEFTTLDQQIVKAVVASAQGVDDALDAGRVQDLVDELIALSGSRHRSFFHRGFADVLLGLEPRDHLPAENASRLQWYWAGYIHGLAREARWPEIVRHLDEQPAIQALGRTPGGASSTTARLVFQALSRQDRPGEGATFLTADVLAADPVLLDAIGDEVRQLLWNDRAAEARGLTDLLVETVDRLVGMGYAPGSSPFLEIRRRRAHCLRQLGELGKARQLLEELLIDDQEPEIRSMVLTDLGLIDGGFRSLAEVRLPGTADRVSALQENLRKGEERFQGSVALDAKYSSHGHYCLGVLAMCRRQWESAAHHLDLALSLFESQPDRYEQGSLLPHARVCLGFALALAVATARSHRAAELIEEAAATGVPLPRYWLSDAIEGLHLASDELARDAAEAVLDADPRLLDELVESDVGSRSGALATALLERARDEARGRSLRVGDFGKALPLLLQQGRSQDAAAALDAMEAAAREGVGADHFVTLLGDPRCYEPAWELSDALWARINVLGASGAREAALPLLDEEFWRVLYSGRFGAEEEAGGILDAMREMGASGETLAPLRKALDEKSGEGGDSVPDLREGELVRVLVVGGDERQARYARDVEDEIRANHPGIRVSFIRPGWGSNWAPDLDEVKRRLPDVDAVVILRFIRTEFGKQMRKALTVPWRGCAGAGRNRMVRSILLAAEMGRPSRSGEG